MQEEPKELTLLDYWNIVYKSRKLIIIVTGVVTVLALVVTLLMPKTYTASVVVLPTELEDISNGGSMYNRNMFSAYGFMIDGGYNYSNIMIAMLKSQRMAQDVSAKFNLKKNDDQDPSDILKELSANMIVTSSKEKVIIISVTSRDPKLCADMANFYVDNLETINADLKITQANPMVRVLDKATPPKKKSGPSIRKNVAITFAVSILVSLIFVLLRAKFKEPKYLT